MGMKKSAEKFETINKAQIRGFKDHSRTGACTAPLNQRCFHGRTTRPILKSKKAKRKTI